MRRSFCDVCDKLLTPTNTFFGQKVDLTEAISLNVVVNGNDDVCTECVMEALRKASTPVPGKATP